ncbi:MAG: YcaO-like family protein [Lachnospiraceae bacterium]|nr:YcaO-like family protein [Lachnospiraceae bacterium]
MIFAKRKDFGVSEEVYIGSLHKSYINFSSVKTNIGFTPGNATAISYDKKMALKKCYSEYLERFAMGLFIDERNITSSFDFLSNKIVYEERMNFAYGNNCIGHSDTTGTAAGYDSEKIIEKALCELIEKNELFCFWYGACGSEIIIRDRMINTLIKDAGFISDEIRFFRLNQISNYSTVLVLGFENKHLITSGICCSNNLREAICGAIEEAKIIEWQQYKNEQSVFNKINEEYINDIYKRIIRPIVVVGDLYKNDLSEEGLCIKPWVKSIRVKMIYGDSKYGLKVIKVVSNELLNSLPTLKNINSNLDKEIVERFFINKELDCPIV